MKKKRRRTTKFLIIFDTISAIALIGLAILYFRWEKNLDGQEDLPVATMDPEVEKTEEEPVEPEPVDNNIYVTVSATGDCSLGKLQIHGYDGSFDAYYDSNGPDYFLQNVRDIFATDDFTLVNCEGVLTNETTHMDKEYVIKGRPEYAAILGNSSVEGASLGNNHTSDYGPQSLIDTKNALAGENIAYAINDEYGIYTTDSGIKIGFVSVSMLGDFQTRSNYMQTGLETLRPQVDLLIACVHMGIERENYANEDQQAFTHNCIDWGADLVVGNHPHVLQGMEIYNGKLIAYSLGNFCYGGAHNPSDFDTLVLQQTFCFSPDHTLLDSWDARIIPCRLSSVPSPNDFCPTPYTAAEDIARVIAKMNEFSSSNGTIQIDETGVIRKL